MKLTAKKSFRGSNFVQKFGPSKKCFFFNFGKLTIAEFLTKLFFLEIWNDN